MTIRDLLTMSLGNLKRRKLRTFLTVLGVIIGTASIVVMISLGLGLQQSMYDELEQAGGLTMLTVTGKGAGESMYYSSSSEEDTTKYITDDAIEEFKQLDHVTMAAPLYELYVNAIKGKYIGSFELIATTREAMEAMNIPLKEGSEYPEEGGSNLELIYGNGLPTAFYEKSTGKGYWDTGEIPDVDLENDSIFLILDSDAYYATMGNNQIGGEAGSDADAPKAPKKYLVRACGMVKGDLNTYNSFYYSAVCDVQTLKNLLKKEYAGRAIPGQPKTKSGKPYRFFAYSSARLKVDELDNMDSVSTTLREMGYNVSSNVEYRKSMQREFFIVEAVLGGIGAVSLLVAAIGIANTMMMSIYERTKEIGVFKVLGCSLKNIRQMFLMEAGFIGLIGGVVGNVLSVIMSIVINLVVANAGAGLGLGSRISYIPFWLILASIGFAILVGMVAGFFPARRAMQLSPLEAIRNN